MKRSIMKLLAPLAGILLAVPAFAGDANQMSYEPVLAPVVSASVTSAALDVSDYKGNAAIVVNWGISTEAAYTGTVTIATSATSGGTYVTITNLAGTAAVLTQIGAVTNEVDTYQIDLARLSKYVKATLTQVTETNAVGVILVAPMKSD